jgi:hypothetical protein
MAKKVQVKVQPPDEAKRQADAAKMTRLRDLRLAKEAADRDAASRKITVTIQKRRGHKSDPAKSQSS